ncbi:hypothetical protein BC830DRAFT_463400 [Chytriomyces sp. MP71]|nr:hypothetical protein BC830DRAFT_463400 [Chytriomyces sp. MP71]
MDPPSAPSSGGMNMSAKRKQQVLAAQARYRAKKQSEVSTLTGQLDAAYARIAELESRVTELNTQASNAFYQTSVGAVHQVESLRQGVLPGPPQPHLPLRECSFCEAEKSRSAFLTRQLALLHHELGQTGSQSPYSASQSPPDSSGSIAQGKSQRIVLSPKAARRSAIEVHGPLILTDAIAALKTLPSFANHHSDIDFFFALFEEKGRCTDEARMKQLIKTKIAKKISLLSCCNVLDRVEAVTIICTVHKLNELHVAHIHQLALPDEEITFPLFAPDELPPQHAKFRSKVTSIPSLRQNTSDIDQLSSMFYSQARCTEPTHRENMFFKIVQICESLSARCTNAADRNQFHLACELGLESNKHLVVSFKSVHFEFKFTSLD